MWTGLTLYLLLVMGELRVLSQTGLAIAAWCASSTQIYLPHNVQATLSCLRVHWWRDSISGSCLKLPIQLPSRHDATIMQTAALWLMEDELLSSSRKLHVPEAVVQVLSVGRPSRYFTSYGCENVNKLRQCVGAHCSGCRRCTLHAAMLWTRSWTRFTCLRVPSLRAVRQLSVVPF